MIRVYSSENIANVILMKAFLEANGVACRIRNQFLGIGRGELPPIQCWPELWVEDEAQAEKACRLVKEAGDLQPDTASEWTCSGCGEQIEGQFGACWNCGSQRFEGTLHEGEPK